MDCSLPGFSVHGFSRQEYWSGLPFPSPGDLPDPGIGPESPTVEEGALQSEPPGKSDINMYCHTKERPEKKGKQEGAELGREEKTGNFVEDKIFHKGKC